MASDMTQHAPSGEVLAAYSLAQSRAADVAELALSIAELKDMFQDVLTLLQHQQEQVASIEDNVRPLQGALCANLWHVWTPCFVSL